MVGHNQGTDTQVHFSVAALEYTVYSIDLALGIAMQFCATA